MTDTLYAGSITSHCSTNEPLLQETGPTTAAGIEPTFYEESGLVSVKIISFYSQMHIP